MSKTKLQHITASFVIAALVVTSLLSVVSAAPVAESFRSSEITGTIPGGEFKEIWLDLEIIEPGRVTVLATWGTDNLDGLGFYILDETDVTNVASGGKARENNLAAGNPMPAFRGTSNQQEATFRATAAMYKLVIFNESANDAEFGIQTTNARIVGDNEYVSDPNAPAATDEAAEEAGEDEATADEADAESTEAETEAADEATTPAPAAVTATTTSTDTVPVSTTATTTTTTTTESGVVRSDTLEGSLPEKDSQHFLGLEPQQKDGRVKLSLAYEPQDQVQLDRRLNFWVLDAEGFNRYLDGETLSRVAIAAGNSNVDTAANERVAEFKVVGLSDYIVIVYNSSTVPATYELVAEDALLVDDSSQTTTAQSAVAQEAEAADEATADEATTADDATPAAAAAPAPATTTGEAGGSYTIQAGDSMSAIARDVYGDIQLYDELCAYNNIENCDVVEVGDVIELPAADELGTGATAPATPAAPAAPAVDVSDSVTTTETTTTTSSVTATDTVTTTAPVTGTTTTTGTTTAGNTTAGSSASLVDVLAADGRFKTLIAALDAANLVDTLEAEGPFTVFAPVDAAFAALPAGALDKLVAQLETNPRGQLLQILLYHVSTGELLSADFGDGVEVQTMQGNTASFVLDDDGNLTLNGATIAEEDILADNGAIHAIEAVILPPVE